MRGKVIVKRRRNPKVKGGWEDLSEYFIDDRQVSKKKYLKAFPPKKTLTRAPDGQATWNKPVISDGLAVVPKRIKDAEAYCAKHGVPTDFSTHRGRPILTSRAHRRKVLKLFQHHDNEGGYGDG